MSRKINSVWYNKELKDFKLGPIMKEIDGWIYLGIHSYKDMGELINELIKCIPRMEIDYPFSIIEDLKKKYPEHLL